MPEKRSPEAELAPKTVLVLAARGFAIPVVILAVVLLLAGRVSYWQGWAFGASNFLLLAANLLVLRDRPDLIRERLAPGEGMKRWDKLYFSLSTPLYLISLVLAALDAGRFRWSPSLPAWAYAAGYAAYAGGQAVHLWAKGANRWFSTVVRLQRDRGQEVCDEGPYRFLRHPGYAGGLLFMLATPVLLGSLVGLVPQALAAGLLVARTHLEDQTLRAELPGYEQYARRVKGRLLPFGQGPG